MCLFLGCFLFCAILLFKPLLYVLDQPENVVELAIPYLDIVAFSLIPLLMFQALKQFSDGLSLTANSMYATILANVVNVIINYILIFGKFGFPQMGIIGAAIGTLISRIIMFGFLFFLLYNRNIIRDYLSYVFKFIIKSSSKQDVFDLLPDAVVKEKKSSKGKYVAITLTQFVKNSSEIVYIYEKASKIKGVISL